MLFIRKNEKRGFFFFSENIAACDLKVDICIRQLIDLYR